MGGSPAETTIAKSRTFPWTTLAAVVAGLQTVAILGWFGWLLTVRHSVEKSEVLVGNLAWQWHHGVFPFTTLDGFPALVNPYGPVYLWLNKVLPWVTGHPYLGGRILSLISTVGVMAILGWLAARRFGGWPMGSLAAALFITARPAIEYGAIVRIDMMVTLFSIAGIACALEAKGRGGLVAAALCFALALHTKSSALAAPVAAGLFLWRRDRRDAVWFAGWFVALTLAALLAMERLSHGQYLSHNALLEIQWTRPFDMLARPFGPSILWVLAFAVGVARLTPDDHRDLAPERLWFVASLLMCAVTSVNRGGSWNYLIEPYAAWALLTAGVLHRAAESPKEPPARAWIPRLVLAHFLLSVVFTAALLSSQHKLLAAYAPRVAAAEAELAPEIQAGQRIAVTASDPAKDALLLLDAGTPIDIMWPQRDIAEGTAKRALDNGQIDRVIDELDRW